uniref:LacI family DNA-binding transcriptional regulator n=1 Tax=Vaginimicrobium propionicum TaxID=1871034 RepID=UPI000970F96C|nr:LacI family DNA-binding transcriptional regulator [Vaginimicrobium propionicum]
MRLTNRPTIKDVAKVADVGVVTVSRALNGQPGVADATRQRIRQVADDLGYRPNRHARFLKLASNRSVALMMKGMDNPFFQQMLDTMETRARKRDYLLNVVKVPHWADEMEEAAQMVDEDAVVGVIFLGGNFSHDHKIFEDFRVPFVISTMSNLVGVPKDSYSSVAVDDLAESKRAVEYLIGLGHRKIALTGVGALDTSVGRLRTNGYRQALSEAGIALDPQLECGMELDGASPYSYEYGYLITKKLLIERPDVTAVFAVADVMAIGALKAVQEAGLRVPEDFSIMGFDGIPVSHYVYPELTTMVQPAKKIAELTCDLLFDQISGELPRHELLAAELHVGGTTAAARV